MPKTNLCEDKMKKKVDYVAGLLRGGFRQNNLSTADVSAKVVFQHEQSQTDFYIQKKSD